MQGLDAGKRGDDNIRLFGNFPAGTRPAAAGADKRIDLFEWSLQKILFHHLDAHFGRPGKRVAKYSSIERLRMHVAALLSVLVHACVKDGTEVQSALESAEQDLGLSGLTLLPREEISLQTLDAAVDHLALLKPLLKPRVLKACLTVITRDREYSPNEMELMRAIGNVLDCPVPPYAG